MKIVYLSLLTLILLSLSCSTPFERGMEALDDDDLPLARTELVQGHTETPEDPYLLLLEARIEFTRRNYPRAQIFMERFLAIKPHWQDADVLYGKIMALQGESLEAALVFSRYYKRTGKFGIENTEFFRILSFGAETALNLGRSSDAIALLTLLKETSPESSELTQLGLDQAHLMGASQKETEGNYQAGLNYCEQISEGSNLYPQSLLCAGKLKVRLGDKEQARQHFDAFLSTPDQNRAEGLLTIAAIMRELREWELARIYYLEALEVTSEKADIYLGLAETAFASQIPQDAETWLKSYLTLLDEKGTLTDQDFIRIQNVVISQGYPELALKILQMGFQKFPDSQLLVRRIVSLNFFMGRRTDALSIIDIFISSQQNTQITYELAEFLLNQQELRLAITYLESIADSPDCPPEVLLILAKTYLREHRSDLLPNQLRRYIEGSENSDDARYTAAQLAHSQQEYGLTEEFLTPMVKASKEKAVMMLGYLYAEWGKFAQEEAHFKKWATSTPEPAAAYIKIGDYLVTRRDYSRSLVYYQKAAQNPDYEAAAQLAIGDVRKKRAEGELMIKAYLQFIEKS